MKTIELLGRLRKNNIKIWIEDDNLRYKGPKEALNEEIIKNLNEHEYEILSLLKEAKQIQNNSSPTTIVEQKKEGLIPLSFPQYRLWFMEQLQPENSLYNIQDVRKIRGPLDLGALKDSLNEIFLRHEGLRTTFSEVDEQPVQIINEKMSLPFKIIDLSEVETYDDVEKETEKIINADAKKYFILSECLFRSIVIKLSSEEHILILSMHHIISDGWSMGILFKELGILYDSFYNGRPSPLPNLAIQYSDYAIWQRNHLQGERLKDELYYWDKQLKNAPSLVELPVDYQRPAAQNYKGSLYSAWFSGSDVEELENICKRNGSTLFMGLLTIYKILLHRYTGQEDIIVGTVTANRNSIELEDIIGFFVNTLPIRSDLTGAPTFVELLKKVRDSCLGAYAHQEVPFEMVVDKIKPDRNLSYTPIVQTLCILQSASDRVEIPGLTTTRVEVDYETAKFDLTLAFEKDADGLLCHIEYNTDLFTEDKIAKLMKSYQLLLKSIIADQFKKISEIQMITKKENEKVLETWNKKDLVNSELCIHEWFEQQVNKSPNSKAIISKKETITYKQLNERANKMAHFLRERGVSNEVRVGICVEKSIDMLVGIIGILKSGGTYVPIDPNYPLERKHYILSDSNAQFLLANKHLLDSFDEELELESISFESNRKYISQFSSENPENNILPNNLAYIIYTSGSTGKPKGVMVPHSNIIRLFKGTEKWFEFNHSDKWALFHSFAFDFSVWEIWGALFYGGQLVLVPYWVSRSVDEFYDLVIGEHITVLNQTPSAFYQFSKADKEINKKLSLRLVIFGGESLDPSKLSDWLEKHGDAKPTLVNMYGITETTVHVTYRPINKFEKNINSMIGQRIPDLELYILDAKMDPVPIGVVGEIHVGGRGLATGYNNLPRLTAERFVPNKFSKEFGSRLYRTGDLGRFTDDRDLEYIGRIDNQVKIRGFRIELDEIQKTFEMHSAVHQALITVYESDEEDKGIVAYFSVKAGGIVDIGELKDYLRQTLPSYMIPNWFVQMDNFPLNQNGKVDRNKLPHPHRERSFIKKEMVLPRTETEQAILEIWKEILRMDAIGINDNFFELGGHSFTAIQFIRKVEKVLRKIVPTSAIFQYPTIQGIAMILDKGTRDNEKEVMIELQPSENEQTLSFIHPVGGNIFCYTGLLQHLDSNYQIYGFKAPGLDGIESPISSIKSLAKRYVTDLLATNRKNHTLLGWSMGGIVAFEMGLQIYNQLGHAPTIIMIDSWSKDLMADSINEDDTFAMFVDDLSRSIGIDVNISKLSNELTVEDKFNKLFELIRDRGFSFIDSDSFDIKYQFEVYKTNLGALSEYVPSKKYPGEILLLRAESSKNEDVTLGWKNWSEKEVIVKTIPGDHYTVFNQPGISFLVEEVTKNMDRYPV